MKTLLIYYSFTGNNEALARKLHDRLQCDMFRIEEAGRRRSISIFFDLIFKRRPKLKEYTLHLEAYDHIVLVSPIWAGKLSTPMQTFLMRESGRIRSYSFISLCGGLDGQRQKISDYLASILPAKPAIVEELWVNDLLPDEQKNSVKYTTPYRIKEPDWRIFNAKLGAFVNAINLKVSERSNVPT
jgi:flavodoxin